MLYWITLSWRWSINDPFTYVLYVLPIVWKSHVKNLNLVYWTANLYAKTGTFKFAYIFIQTLIGIYNDIEVFIEIELSSS